MFDLFRACYDKSEGNEIMKLIEYFLSVIICFNKIYGLQWIKLIRYQRTELTTFWSNTDVHVGAVGRRARLDKRYFWVDLWIQSRITKEAKKKKLFLLEFCFEFQKCKKSTVKKIFKNVQSKSQKKRSWIFNFQKWVSKSREWRCCLLYPARHAQRDQHYFAGHCLVHDLTVMLQD